MEKQILEQSSFRLPLGFVSVGPQLLIMAAFFFGILGLLIKMMGPSFRVWDLAFFRFLGSLVILVLFFRREQNLFTPENPKLMIIRGVTGSIAFICIVSALKIIPLSTAMVLFYWFPAFSVLFSYFLFGEKITMGEIICVIVSICGVAVLFNITFEGQLLGQGLALMGGIFAGLTVSIIKKLRVDNGSVIIYFYFCLVGFVITVIPFFNDYHFPANLMEWLLITGIIVTSTAGQLAMNMGFKYCKSWEGGAYLTSELIFTSLFGILLLGEPATWRLGLGGILIFGSAVAFNMGFHRRDPIKV